MAKKTIETETEQLTNFLIDKVVKVVPVVRPNSWSHKYQITEDGKDKTNGAYQFNTALTYLSVPVSKKTGIIHRPLDNITKVRTTQFPNEEITKTFSNMLCSDWHINYKDVFMFQGKYTNEYLLEIVKLVNQINSLDLNKIHYSNSLRSVLSYLSDSDI